MSGRIAEIDIGKSKVAIKDIRALNAIDNPAPHPDSKRPPTNHARGN
jgi:hypothetical protein